VREGGGKAQEVLDMSLGEMLPPCKQNSEAARYDSPLLFGLEDRKRQSLEDACVCPHDPSLRRMQVITIHWVETGNLCAKTNEIVRLGFQLRRTAAFLSDRAPASGLSALIASHHAAPLDPQTPDRYTYRTPPKPFPRTPHLQRPVLGNK
jgi:hypothetical protein